MTIFRQYQLAAKDGQADVLRVALLDLAKTVLSLPGCEGVELLEDIDDPNTIFFVEQWTSRDHHAEGGKVLGKSAFAPLMACVSAPPIGRYLRGGKITR